MSQIPKYKNGTPKIGSGVQNDSDFSNGLFKHLNVSTPPTVDMDRYKKMLQFLDEHKYMGGHRMSQKIDKLLNDYKDSPQDLFKNILSDPQIRNILVGTDFEITTPGVRDIKPSFRRVLSEGIVTFTSDAAPRKTPEIFKGVHLDPVEVIDEVQYVTSNTPAQSNPSKSTQSTSSHEAISQPVASRIKNTQDELISNSENPEEEELEIVDFDLLSDNDKNFDLQSLNPKTPKSKYSLPLTPIVSTISMLNRKRTNDRVFNKLNKNLKPTIIDTPRDINYTIQGNEGVRNQYRKAAADTRNLLITPQSSDMNSNLAYSLAVNKQANDYALQGDLANEQALQQSREKAFQVQTENQRRREQVAAQNQQSITNTKNYKAQLDAQRVSKNADNWNTYLHDLIAQIKHRSDEINLAKRAAEHERLQLYGLNLNNRKEYLNKLLTSGNYTEEDKGIINNQIKEIDGLIESLKKSTINNKYSTNPIW